MRRASVEANETIGRENDAAIELHAAALEHDDGGDGTDENEDDEAKEGKAE